MLACLGVLVASSTPNLIFVDDPLADLVARKLGHLFAFMAIAFGAGLTAGTSLPRSYTACLLVMGTASLALLDEAIQSRIPGRLSSPIDVVLDLLGAVCGIAAWLRFERWREAR